MSEVLRIESWDEVPGTAPAGALLLEITARLPGDPVSGLRRLGTLDIPIVTALSGAGGPELLAAALRSSVAIADPGLTVDVSDARAVLTLGIPWLLERRGAGALLFAPGPLDAASLGAAGITTRGLSAQAVATTLAADSAKRLLVRSLRAAARSTAAQSAAYDAELSALL